MLEKIFTFPYYHQGTLHHLTLPTQHVYSPVRPVIEALGVDRETATNTAKQYPHELIKMSGFRGASLLCLKPEHIGAWLGKMRSRKDPEKLRHFQTHYAAALNRFLEDANQTPAPRRVLQAQAGIDYQTEAAAMSQLVRDFPIYADKPLDAEGRLRLICNQMGCTQSDFIEYFAKTIESLLLCRPSRLGDSRPFESWLVHKAHLSKRSLHIFLAGQWDLAPVFFLKYPYTYTRQTRDFIVPKMNAQGRPTTDLTVKTFPKDGMPWNNAAFARKIGELIGYIEKQQAEEAAERERLIRENPARGMILLSEFFNLGDDDDMERLALPSTTENPFQPQAIIRSERFAA